MPDLVTRRAAHQPQERKKLRVRVLSTALAAAVVALIVGIGGVLDGAGAARRRRAGPDVAMTPVDGDGAGLADSA
jgi:hypothetical protein